MTKGLALEKKRESFAGDVLKLVSGTTVAQVLNILSAPLLARIYGPEVYGIAALFFSIVGVIAVISCFRYEMSIMLPESDGEASNLMVLSFLISLFVSILSIPVILLFGPFFLSLLNAQSLTRYLWLIPILLLWGGLGIGHPALNYWNSRTKHYGRLSIIQIINSVITLGGQIGAGLLGYNNEGSLILSMVVGSIASTSILGLLIWRDDNQIFRLNVNLKRMLAGLKRYNKFPRYDSFAVFLNSLSWQLPSYLLSAFFSTTIVGYYSLGNRVLRLPMNFIGSSIAQVFFQRAAEAKNNNNLAPLVENVFQILVKLGMFPMLLLSIISYDLFIVVFGSNWGEAGIYTQILSVWMFFWFISSPLSTLFRVLELQEFSLGINIAIFVTRLISLWIGGKLGDARLALGLFAISGIILYGYLSISTILSAGVSRRNAYNIILNSLLIFLPAGVLLVVLKMLAISSLAIVLISGVIIIFYGLYVLKTEKWLHKYIFNLLGKISPRLANKLTG